MSLPSPSWMCLMKWIRPCNMLFVFWSFSEHTFKDPSEIIRMDEIKYWLKETKTAAKVRNLLISIQSSCSIAYFFSLPLVLRRFLSLLSSMLALNMLKPLWMPLSELSFCLFFNVVNYRALLSFFLLYLLLLLPLITSCTTYLLRQTYLTF